MTIGHYPFAKLIAPVTPEQFFAEYWEKKPLIIHRDDPGYYRDLLTFEKVNHCITSLEHHHDSIFMGNFEREISAKDYTYESGLIDVARLYSQFADGSSIALNHLHDRIDSLGNLCRSMEQELSIRFQTNVYFTPPDAQCFPPHYDSHCVFALQCEGKKSWRLYDVPLELPHHNQKFVPGEVPIGDVTEEFVLSPGDFVYCPRGLGHDADTKGLDEPSLHVTLGVLQHNWTDLLLEALAQVSIDDPVLRAALPVGFARPDFDRTQARETYAKLLKHVVDKMDFDTALDFFVDDVISTRHPLLPGQFDQIMQLGELDTVDRRAGRRPNVLYRIEEKEESVTVLAYGGSLTFPIHASAPLRHALENDDYLIAALPGELDDPGKLVLIKKLVREGLVVLK